MKYIDRDLRAKKIDKRWGYEICKVNNKEEDYCSKIISINEDFSTSMHYHINKHEAFYVRAGILRVDTLDTETSQTVSHFLEVGDVLEVERYLPHQLIAHNGPVEIDETSTFSCPTDSHRVYKDFKELFDETKSSCDA